MQRRDRFTEMHVPPNRLSSWIADAWRDLHYAARTLLRAPGFTAVAVLTLALGIGAVTIIYSVLHNVLLDPLPYPGSDRLVNVMIRDAQTGRVRGGMRGAEILDFQASTTVFEDIIGTAGEGLMYSGPDRAEVLRAVWVTPNFFDFMGLPPLLGRAATADDGRPDAPPVAVLRHRAWVSYFGADPAAVGRTVLLNGQPRTIVGVMPPRFTWHAADVWLPKRLDRGEAQGPGAIRSFQARLKPGVTLAPAEAQMTAAGAARARAHPQDYPESFNVQVVNVIAFTVGAFSGVLYTTLAAVALLMLIACCNVANMLLARGTVRERELSVRAALGAGRGRIVRQLFVESLLLAFAGAAGGCLLAYVGIDALVAMLPPNPLPGEVEIALDGAALLISLMVAVASALLFGIAPAVYGARRDLADSLRQGGKGVAGSRGRLRNLLVAGEIALSLVLLLGAGLLMRTFVSLVRVDLGFNPSHVLSVPLTFAPGAHAAPADRYRFYQESLDRIRVIPGVIAASASTGLPPFEGPLATDVEIPGRPRTAAWATVVQLCTPEYFRTLALPILRGDIVPELRPGELPRVAVINQAFAASFFGADDPIGRQIRLTPKTGSPDPSRHGVFEVVGVAGDVRNQGLRLAPAPQVYLPGATITRAAPVILIRTAAEPMAMLQAVRGAIASVDRGVAIRQPGALDEILQRSFYAEPRFSLIVLGVFAIAGTVLVAVGIFSVMAYSVSRQAREIAVRVALGASRGHVLGLVLRLGLRLLAAGVAAGVITSVAATRLIASQLWNTSPYDPAALAGAVAVISVVALAACYIPAARALRIDPIVALRLD